MYERRQAGDRRSEPRHPVASRITWKRRGAEATTPGWLSDTSRSGVSFVVSRAHQPSLGEEIELSCSVRLGERCRVVRISPYDENLALVGCCSVPAGACGPTTL